MQFIMGNFVHLLFAFCKCSNKYIFVIEKLAWQQYFWYITMSDLLWSQVMPLNLSLNVNICLLQRCTETKIWVSFYEKRTLYECCFRNGLKEESSQVSRDTALVWYPDRPSPPRGEGKSRVSGLQCERMSTKRERNLYGQVLRIDWFYGRFRRLFHCS